MPTFLQNFTDKAQNALNSSPLGPHLQQFTGNIGQSGHNQPSPNDSAGRSYAFENIQHQFRTLQQQYVSNTNPLQRVITAQKGVAIDYEGVSRDTKAQSKELFVWGQNEAEDLKDVTDRLAYLNFVHGALSSSLSSKLSTSRNPLKSLRDAEAALQPRRNIRAGIAGQITKIKNEGRGGPGVERKLGELYDSLKRAEEEDVYYERELEILKRKYIKESEDAKWTAIREYAEKLILISQASTPILSALPSIPPSQEMPYQGARATASTRASLQRALDNWDTGYVNVPSFPAVSSKDSIDSDTRSFGVSHASELSSIQSNTGPSSSNPNLSSGFGYPSPPAPVPVQSQHSSGIDPANLNNSPVNFEYQSGKASATPSSSSSNNPYLPDASGVVDVGAPASGVPTLAPTVAETGKPLSGGASGPGPATGSLRRTSDSSRAPGYAEGALHHDGPFSYQSGEGAPHHDGPFSYQSPEDEKRRLQREERDRLLQAGGSSWGEPASSSSGGTSSQHYESAEDEKKRLEREEQESVAKLNAKLKSNGSQPSPPAQDDSGPPPYQG